MNNIESSLKILRVLRDTFQEGVRTMGERDPGDFDSLRRLKDNTSRFFSLVQEQLEKTIEYLEADQRSRADSLLPRENEGFDDWMTRLRQAVNAPMKTELIA